jgi:hypothetical protein
MLQRGIWDKKIYDIKIHHYVHYGYATKQMEFISTPLNILWLCSFVNIFNTIIVKVTILHEMLPLQDTIHDPTNCTNIT